MFVTLILKYKILSEATSYDFITDYWLDQISKKYLLSIYLFVWLPVQLSVYLFSATLSVHLFVFLNQAGTGEKREWGEKKDRDE